MSPDHGQRAPGASLERGIFRQLLRESSVYGLGGVASQALAIVLVPIYANELGAAGYGVVAVLTTTLSIANLIADLALQRAFFRSYLNEATDESERLNVLRTAVGLRIVASLSALVVYTALAVPLSAVLLGTTDQWHLLSLIAPIAFFDSLNLIPMAYLRALRRPLPYAVLSFARAVGGSALIVLFVVVADLGVTGVLLGSLFASAAVSVFGWLALVRMRPVRPSLDIRLARHMLAFSLPLVPASVAGWVLNVSDRYLIQAFSTSDAVGIYSAGYTAGLAINALAVAPFTLAWGASYWELGRREDAPQLVARVLTGFVALGSLVALGLAALGTDAIRLLFDREFEAARFVVPFSAFAYVFYGVFSIVSTGLNLRSQTRHLPAVLIGSALLSIAINLLLIPMVGFIGAAISTIVSYAVLAIGAGLISQRYFPVPWQLRRVTAVLVLAMMLAAAALLGPDHTLWRLGCVLAYPLVVISLRIVPMNLLESLLRLKRP